MTTIVIVAVIGFALVAIAAGKWHAWSQAREADLTSKRLRAMRTGEESPEAEEREPSISFTLKLPELPGTEAKRIARGSAISGAKERLGRLRVAYEEIGFPMTAKTARKLGKELRAIQAEYKLTPQDCGIGNWGIVSRYVSAIEASEAERIGARTKNPQYRTRGDEPSETTLRHDDTGMTVIGDEGRRLKTLDNRGLPREHDRSRDLGKRKSVRPPAASESIAPPAN